MAKSNMKVQVENFLSPRTGNPVANQFKVITPQGCFFQSYSTVIGLKDNKGNVYVTNDWDCSNTTLKYFKEWLRTSCSKKEIQEKIDNGEYKMVKSLSAV